MPSKPKELLAAIDALIAKYGDANPELAKELQLFRAELADHLTHRRWKDLATATLRLKALIDFVLDQLDGSG